MEPVLLPTTAAETFLRTLPANAEPIICSNPADYQKFRPDKSWLKKIFTVRSLASALPLINIPRQTVPETNNREVQFVTENIIYVPKNLVQPINHVLTDVKPILLWHTALPSVQNVLLTRVRVIMNAEEIGNTVPDANVRQTAQSAPITALQIIFRHPATALPVAMASTATDIVQVHAPRQTLAPLLPVVLILIVLTAPVFATPVIL